MRRIAAISLAAVRGRHTPNIPSPRRLALQEALPDFYFLLPWQLESAVDFVDKRLRRNNSPRSGLGAHNVETVRRLRTFSATCHAVPQVIIRAR